MRPFKAILADYVQISKPRIILLLLIVAWAAMFMADGGVPDGLAFAMVSVAGTLSTAASGAFNNVIERRQDARMGRTADRPVASGRISPAAALTYALLLSAGSFAALWFIGKELAAFLTLGAIAFYVLIYTVALKPTTPQNIVLGGFAGSFPALIGWAAVTGDLSMAAWLLAGIVFFWTPPHFWALALLYKEDYEAAEYPMMPTIKGETSTKRQMVLYAVLTGFASIGLFVVGEAGYVFLAAATLLGFKFIKGAADLLHTDDRQRYRRYFLFTISYLGVLLIALIVDVMVVSVWPQLSPLA